MGSNEKADGLARVSDKESSNQNNTGAKGKGAAIKRLGPLASARSNPTKGGGINRALKSGSAN